MKLIRHSLRTKARTTMMTILVKKSGEFRACLAINWGHVGVFVKFIRSSWLWAPSFNYILLYISSSLALYLCHSGGSYSSLTWSLLALSLLLSIWGLFGLNVCVNRRREHPHWRLLLLRNLESACAARIILSCLGRLVLGNTFTLIVRTFYYLSVWSRNLCHRVFL